MAKRSHPKSKGVTIDDLAIMVGKGFERMDGRLENVDIRLNKVEEEVKELHDDVRGARCDILEVGDRFAPRYEFDNLLVRFNRLDQKVIGKPRR